MESGQTKSFASLFGKDPEKAKEERLTKLNQQIRDVSLDYSIQKYGKFSLLWDLTEKREIVWYSSSILNIRGVLGTDIWSVILKINFIQGAVAQWYSHSTYCWIELVWL